MSTQLDRVDEGEETGKVVAGGVSTPQDRCSSVRLNKVFGRKRF